MDCLGEVEEGAWGWVAEGLVELYPDLLVIFLESYHWIEILEGAVKLILRGDALQWLCFWQKKVKPCLQDALGDCWCSWIDMATTSLPPELWWDSEVCVQRCEGLMRGALRLEVVEVMLYPFVAVLLGVSLAVCFVLHSSLAHPEATIVTRGKINTES